MKVQSQNNHVRQKGRSLNIGSGAWLTTDFDFHNCFGLGFLNKIYNLFYNMDVFSGSQNKAHLLPIIDCCDVVWVSTHSGHLEIFISLIDTCFDTLAEQHRFYAAIAIWTTRLSSYLHDILKLAVVHIVICICLYYGNSVFVELLFETIFPPD